MTGFLAWSNVKNKLVMQTILPFFVCPSALAEDSRRSLVGTVNTAPGDYAAPSSVLMAGNCVMNCTNTNELWSFHTGGTNNVFCDGGAHFLAETLDLAPVCALVTRASERIGYNY